MIERQNNLMRLVGAVFCLIGMAIAIINIVQRPHYQKTTAIVVDSMKLRDYSMSGRETNDISTWAVIEFDVDGRKVTSGLWSSRRVNGKIKIHYNINNPEDIERSMSLALPICFVGFGLMIIRLPGWLKKNNARRV